MEGLDFRVGGIWGYGVGFEGLGERSLGEGMGSGRMVGRGGGCKDSKWRDRAAC